MNADAVKLKYASFEGDLDEVRRLLDAGVDPNSTDEYGSGTLLTFQPTIIEYLLSRGADPNNQTNENGASVLAGLAHVNKLECVRILLGAGADPNRGRDESGETPLHHALTSSEADRTPLVKLLLDHGADPNARTKPGIPSCNFWRDANTRGETPLHRAAAFSPRKTIELLLAAGADRAMRDVNGDSPLGWASWHLRDKAIIDLLDFDHGYDTPRNLPTWRASGGLTAGVKDHGYDTPRNPMNIRPYQTQDQNAVLDLWERCGLIDQMSRPVAEADIRRKLQVQPELFLVGVLDNEVIATAMAGYDGHRGHLYYLAVCPRRQRQGHGRQIVSQADRLLQERGCHRLTLFVSCDNLLVTGFYKRLGFEHNDVVSMGRNTSV